MTFGSGLIGIEGWEAIVLFKENEISNPRLDQSASKGTYHPVREMN
jgi:hypothetical protein